MTTTPITINTFVNTPVGDGWVIAINATGQLLVRGPSFKIWFNLSDLYIN